jgi:hypothetical protein
MNIRCFFGFHRFEPRYAASADPAVIVTNAAVLDWSHSTFHVPVQASHQYIGDSCRYCPARKEKAA